MKQSQARNYQSTTDTYPSLSQLCNDIDQSINAGLLAQAEAFEEELTRPDLPLIQGEKCSISLLEASDLTLIKCKKCRRPVHYNCNTPKGCAYYKKHCANFMCQFCKSN